VTFRKLVALKDNSINFPAFNVSDWPDIRYRNSGSLMYPFRQAFWFSKNKSSESAKKFIDWLLDHKINMTSGTQEDCDDLLLKEEERKWLKEVCEYAKARGIYVEWLTKTAVGVCRDEKEDKMGKDCIRYSGLYYCWSNDELINKRAQEMVQYLKDTGLSAIFIHSMDTTNSKWQDRCQSCRDKFGDDRFSGDAYVFNHYRDEIRKSFPDMPITIVPRPYNKSIDDISHVQSGEIKSKDDLKRFSKMLAEDVYVCHRETDRTASLSWVNVFKQPMNTCTMAWYLSVPFLIGRDFTPVCRYFRTYNYPLSNEMASYIVHSSTRDKIQCLGFVEYSWNLNAPGSAEYSETPEEYKQIWDPFGKDMLKNRELQAFIKRACNELFAPQYAKYFYNKFLLFTDRYFVDNYQEVRYALEKGSNPQPGMMPDIDDSKCIDFMHRCYDNSNIIIKDLEELKGKTTDQDIVGAVNRFLAWQYEERAVSHIYMLILEAEQASKEGNHEKAGKLIKDACQASDDDPKQLKADWHKIQGQADEILVKIPQDPEELKKHKIFLDMIKTRIQSREMMSKRKKNAGVEKNETPKANKPVSAAVFAPDSQGGLTYGRTGLLNLLKGINDISVEEIDNLSLETLKKYDCVIIPDCKSFGK
ncbi:MAG: hypothetical protein NT118_15545, partial [Lentisphaerae bacterium]|nr:hypothetical protein [Lentisphaerota bacterium]